MKKRINTLLLMFLSLSLFSQTITDIVVNSPVHETLEAAVIAAELDDDLASSGPFTLFAPTDAAFAALPAGTVDALLLDPTGELAQILLYHVLGAEVLSTDLTDGQIATTLQGGDVQIAVNSDGVFIHGAKVTVADINASNGVVHVIDMVLLPPQPTAVDIIVNSPDHETLEAAVIAAELADDLSGDGPFTVFAPTDAAFDALPAGTVDALLQDPTGELAQILLYHVLGAEVLSTDLSDGQMATTLQGEDITVTINTDGVFINNAQVTVADIEASNGVVHVIDMVLLPPQPSVVDIIVNSPDHETLEAAVIAAELADDLSGDGPFTVFAPTDAAFDALPAGTVDALLQDPTGELAQILLYHVLGAEVLSTDLTDGQMATTLQGDDITVTINTDGVFINNAQVTVADINASNGVVHVLDMVLLPPQISVVDIIVNSPDHETLEAAVIAAELNDDLSGSGPFTVFAPTDAAFDALPAGALDDLLADPTGALAQVLLYHVLGAEVLSGTLTDGQMAATLQGANITVTINGSDVLINNAQVTVADIQADNGVVHVIDAVLLPPAQVDLPITFEDDNVDYALADFGDNASAIVADPTDPNNTVVESTKLVTAQTWAGTTAGGNGLANPIPFAATETKMTVRVWSPEAGTPILLKVEDATDPGISVETLTNTSVAMQWETLEFDFSNEAPGTAALDLANTYDKVSIFFNFGTDGATAGEQTYYWDDVKFGPRITVVDIIVNSPDHETLEAAVIAAELADDLSGNGPFTVFAPTDAAFDALPAGTVDALLQDPTGQLAQILLYHVLGAEVLSTDLSDGQMATTLQGEDITVTINTDGVFINNAKVTVADIAADNGVVHVIDMVLLPPSITSVSSVNQGSISVSPNPTSDFVDVQFPAEMDGEKQVQLMNASGKVLLFQNTQDNSSNINLMDLPSGIYFLRIDTEKGSYFDKVLKN